MLSKAKYNHELKPFIKPANQLKYTCGFLKHQIFNLKKSPAEAVKIYHLDHLIYLSPAQIISNLERVLIFSKINFNARGKKNYLDAITDIKLFYQLISTASKLKFSYF